RYRDSSLLQAFENIWLVCEAFYNPQWRPISTAKKDGKSIMTIVNVQNCIPNIVQWVEYNGEGKWFNDPEDFVSQEAFEEAWNTLKYSPTHWMPVFRSPADIKKG